MKWLERAYCWINTPDLDQLSRAAAELRFAISRALVHAHLHTEAPDRLDKAENLAQFLENELGDTMMVLLLRLEILVATPAESFDSSSYASVIRRMITTTDLSDVTFKVILHHIRKLEDKSPSTGMTLLDQFLQGKILSSGCGDWIERVTVLRTYMATTYRESQDTSKSLATLFDGIKETGHMPLSAITTNAIQTVGYVRLEVFAALC